MVRPSKLIKGNVGSLGNGVKGGVDDAVPSGDDPVCEVDSAARGGCVTPMSVATTFCVRMSGRVAVCSGLWERTQAAQTPKVSPSRALQQGQTRPHQPWWACGVQWAGRAECVSVCCVVVAG